LIVWRIQKSSTEGELPRRGRRLKKEKPSFTGEIPWLYHIRRVKSKTGKKDIQSGARRKENRNG